MLQQLGLNFEIFRPDVMEHVDPAQLEDSLLETARRKALDAKRCYSTGLSIGCDTIVAQADLVFGKPIDRTHAREMLLVLSGKAHQVKSAVVLVDLAQNHVVSGIETTNVQFRALTITEIERYLDTGEPFDKAGAYAIQGHGSILVERIEGCFSNVIGFPVSLFLKLKSEIERTKQV